MLAGMNGDMRCDRRREPRAGRGDPVGRGHALPAVSGCAAPVRDRPHPHRARRRGRHRDRDPAAGPLQRLLATRVLLPAELMVRRADSTEVIGNALVAKSRGAGYGKHRRPLRASRVDRPPIVAGRARAALAVALPPQRRPCGPGRPGSCWSGRRTVADIVLAATRAGCWLLAGCDRLIDPSDGSRGLLSAVRDVHEFTNRGMMRLFIPSCLVMRIDLPRRDFCPFWGYPTMRTLRIGGSCLALVGRLACRCGSPDLTKGSGR